jgi:hypothetical protein
VKYICRPALQTNVSLQAVLDAKISKNILALARDQQDEIEQDEWVDEEDEDSTPLQALDGSLLSVHHS